MNGREVAAPHRCSTASYRTYAGSGVDRGLRAADTANSALGHAMVQVVEKGSSFNIGIATGKAKYWESRYVRIRTYENRIHEFVARFRFPPATGVDALLPTLARGERLDAFPRSLVVAIELNPRLGGQSWQIGELSHDVLDFDRDEGADEKADRLNLVAMIPGQESTPAWRGWQDPGGIVHDAEEIEGQTTRQHRLGAVGEPRSRQSSTLSAIARRLRAQLSRSHRYMLL